jgi:hypothetical protein
MVLCRGNQQGKQRWFASGSMSDKFEGFVSKQQERLADATRGLAKNLSKVQQQGGAREGVNHSQQPRAGPADQSHS